MTVGVANERTEKMKKILAGLLVLGLLAGGLLWRRNANAEHRFGRQGTGSATGGEPPGG